MTDGALVDIRGGAGGARAAPSPEAVLAAVARHYGKDASYILSRRRHRHRCQLRHLAMYVSVALGNSMVATGRAFARDHTTVSHAMDRIERDARLLAEANTLVARLEAGHGA